MGSKKSAVRAHAEEWEVEDRELPNEELSDRTLILRREPRPWKTQLMAAGVKEIRCVCCGAIRPIAGAEELGEGWICEDCLSDAEEKMRCGGQRGE